MGVGHFQNKNSYTAKNAYEIVQGESCHGKSNSAIALYSPGPVFDAKNVLAQAIVHRKHSPKARKKFLPQKITQPTTPSKT